MKYVLNQDEFVKSLVIGAIEFGAIPESAGAVKSDQVQVELVGNGAIITVPDGKATKAKAPAAESNGAAPPRSASPAANGRKRRTTAAAPEVEEQDEVFDGVPVKEV